jgi:hypothetical protein
MDRDVTLAYPLATVFGRVATPARLADWLPDVISVHPDPQPAAEPDAVTTFRLRLRRGGGEVVGIGELIAFEPPWSAAYRLVAGPATYVLRLTCTASGGATRLSVRQAGGPAPLAVDLARLSQRLAVTTVAVPDGPAG